MALLFFTEDYERLYNCTFYNYAEKPIEIRSFPVKGWLNIAIFSIVWILYIPCIIAMCDKYLLKFSCYKLMLYLAFLDLNTSLYTGLWAGIVNVTGNVFCHWPILAYWIGCFNGMAWKMQSPATVLLAFNRCIEAFDEKLANKLFDGKRIFLWMSLPVIWGCRDLLLGPPGIYNPILSVIIYNPHAGYFADENFIYTNKTIFYNNYFCGVSIVVIYGVLGISIFFKSKKSSVKIAGQTKVFGQILFISAFLFSICIGYLLIQYIKTAPEIFSTVLQYAFLIFDGVPAVIYLTLNKTLRKKVSQMFSNPFHSTQTTVRKTAAISGINKNIQII